MKRRVLKTGVQARESLIKGANILAEATRLTLGPFSLHAAMEKNDEIIDDGVTVAREIAAGCIHDEIEARGARLMLQVATKTDEIAGDGTTTSIVLAHAITKEAKKYLADEKTFAAKKTPADVQAQLSKECDEVIGMLKDMAKPITSSQELVEATTVSATDPELGKLIGEAQWELGKNGVILAEETADRDCSIERIHGVRIDNGFGTSMIMNNQEKQSLEIEDVPVLMTNYVIQDLKPIEELGKSLAKTGVRKLVVIARAFGENAIRDCLENIKHGFAIFPINAPYTNQNEIMKDLGAVLGGNYIGTETAVLEAVQLSDLGYASNVVAYRYNAVLAGKDDEKVKQRVATRIEELRKQMTGSVSEHEKKQLEERISQLDNGYALAKIGAVTELRRKYLKRKADDAVSASRAALQEGVVAGGGLAFKEISDKLPEDYILKRPLLAVNQQIMSSAPAGFTIDSKIVDSVKVLRVALEQACSIASIFANSGIAIAEKQTDPVDLALKRLASTSKGEDSE